MKGLLACIALFTASLGAADLNGTWKYTSWVSPSDTLERTFTFKVNGSRLTGETTSPVYGRSVTENGKVDGKKISFETTVKVHYWFKWKFLKGPDEVKFSFHGEFDGSAIRFTVDGPYGKRREYTAKRVS